MAYSRVANEQHAVPSSPASTMPADPRPLWQRMLLRRLKFLGAIVLLLALALGGT
jgi:hypothetical protein